jgi:hypothetical protein
MGLTDKREPKGLNVKPEDTIRFPEITIANIEGKPVSVGCGMLTVIRNERGRHSLVFAVMPTPNPAHTMQLFIPVPDELFEQLKDQLDNPHSVRDDDLHS